MSTRKSWLEEDAVHVIEICAGKLATATQIHAMLRAFEMGKAQI
jgi:hypothetical protein